ncbi:mitochondrial 37S ribosomal protein uS4m [Aspergillus clavatus NRRL 1]|uniref:Small ribosomal subunit protein uS4m n=1 Tax=Aspergillus clavatus (strain ATCC 1007 / CBS 513.65 / DSM 816 / NCTC 3887 / NRRL 1 / QM 1276 / 107) TaxID=344612 RepID=A1CQW4_ASPCL|nr:mitochondrial 37S ribosomal protein NAM9 [Aspergillus clavatus NRRL 1]EAW08035.1 30S ribosomal subunit S4, putative [Aspergillus clavatus NRRL 1]
MRNRATTPLSKAKIRQSWSKYNLFNLNRFRAPPTVNRTFFQQKWSGKSVARAYHGEQVPESQWSRMFTRRIRSVVPMDPVKLATDDGSKMSAGRGSGLETEADASDSKSSTTPFTQMTFAPLERRLDVAIFRAMFASSARQARQFVVHGAVTVNGKKMRYPGYLLNPGDLFQVEPDRVMYATGAPKDKFERRESRVARKKGAQSTEGEAAEGEEGAVAEEKGDNKEELDTAAAEEQPKENPKEALKTLLTQAKTIMSDSKDVLPAKRKQELRGFQKAVRRILSRSESSTVLTDNLESQFSELVTLLKAKKAEKKKGGKESAESKPAQATEASTAASESNPTTTASAQDQPTDKLTEAFQKAALDPEADVDTSELTDDEFEVLRRALIQMRDNPIDHSKPYATPWRPRDYMGAFAFIPRYLEVNHNICAAVYLRHPVARPGRTEVPTPFPESVGTAAFAWYLRRR